MTTSTVLSANILNQIITQGNEIITQNRLVRRKSTPYCTKTAQCVNQQLILQSGYTGIKLRSKKIVEFETRQDKGCCSFGKDNNSTTMIKKRVSKVRSPSKQASCSSARKRYQYSADKLSSKTTTADNFLYKRRSLKVETTNPFIKLHQTQSSGRMVIERVKKEQEEKEAQLRVEIQERKEQQKQQPETNLNKNQETKRINAAQQFNRFLRENPSNSFTYDNDGKIIYHNKERKQKSMEKEYPPQVNYLLEKEGKDWNSRMKTRQDHQRVRAGKGEAFASAVLKTVNLSRMTLNTSINGEFDPIKFMKRNDLFNNNHSRQTTSIPFFEVKEGTVYTEVGNKECLSKKDGTTEIEMSRPSTSSHYLAGKKSKFKKYSTTKNGRGHSAVVAEYKFNDFDGSDSGLRPAKTADQPHHSRLESRRPQTSGRTGRITTTNHLLVEQLLD